MKKVLIALFTTFLSLAYVTGTYAGEDAKKEAKKDEKKKDEKK